MSIGGIVALAVVAVLLSVLLKQYKPEFSVMLSLAVTVIIFIALRGKIEYIAGQLNELFNSLGYMGEFAQVLLKGLGICLIIQIASDVCKDAGENSIGTKLELAGKVAVLFISLPLVMKVLETATSLIEGGGVT